MAKKTRKIQAFAYLRVSGSSQAAKGKDGFPRQCEAITKYTKKHRIEIVGEYRDDVSGTNDMHQRPEFEKMVAAMLGNGVRAVVVERLDRLARAYVIQEELAMYLASHGIDLYSADTEENITEAMMGDPMKKAIIQIRGVFHELDKSMLVRKLRRARDVKSEKVGRRIEGRKAYGSRPEEKKALARMKQLYRKQRGVPRMSYGRIADTLNKEGYKPRQGKKWYAMTVRNILLRK